MEKGDCFCWYMEGRRRVCEWDFLRAKGGVLFHSVKFRNLGSRVSFAAIVETVLILFFLCKKLWFHGAWEKGDCLFVFYEIVLSKFGLLRIHSPANSKLCLSVEIILRLLMFLKTTSVEENQQGR